jgi:hypothetical protein
MGGPGRWQRGRRAEAWAASGAVFDVADDRLYERLDITRMTGINDAQHAALLALGAIQQPGGTHGT